MLDLLASLPRNDFRPEQGALWTNVHIDDSINYDDIKPGQRLPFRQANDLQNNRIQEWVGEKITGMGRDKAILELFCGSGNFTEPLSRHGFNNILGVDMSSDAVDTLRMKDLPGVRCLVANLYEKQAYGRIGKEMKTPEVMLFDPPRDGLKRRKEILSLASKSSDIFYISCDPATFVRDVRDFVVLGFEPGEVQPLDMFPHTPHVEILAHLQKAKS
ncbi:MAG: hypothetical protein HN368_00215 [Spirochaetales bacterium]|nr:hypothetical protein [Spirochaetales bacterium]